jgi:hypothetical protein
METETLPGVPPLKVGGVRGKTQVDAEAATVDVPARSLWPKVHCTKRVEPVPVNEVFWGVYAALSMSNHQVHCKRVSCSFLVQTKTTKTSESPKLDTRRVHGTTLEVMSLWSNAGPSRSYIDRNHDRSEPLITKPRNT